MSYKIPFLGLGYFSEQSFESMHHDMKVRLFIKSAVLKKTCLKCCISHKFLLKQIFLTPFIHLIIIHSILVAVGRCEGLHGSS